MNSEPRGKEVCTGAGYVRGRYCSLSVDRGSTFTIQLNGAILRYRAPEFYISNPKILIEDVDYHTDFLEKLSAVRYDVAEEIRMRNRALLDLQRQVQIVPAQFSDDINMGLGAMKTVREIGNILKYFRTTRGLFYRDLKEARRDIEFFSCSKDVVDLGREAIKQAVERSQEVRDNSRLVLRLNEEVSVGLEDIARRLRKLCKVKFNLYHAGLQPFGPIEPIEELP